MNISKILEHAVSLNSAWKFSCCSARSDRHGEANSHITARLRCECFKRFSGFSVVFFGLLIPSAEIILVRKLLPKHETINDKIQPSSLKF
jgi:hypothetical protein